MLFTYSSLLVSTGRGESDISSASNPGSCHDLRVQGHSQSRSETSSPQGALRAGRYDLEAS